MAPSKTQPIYQLKITIKDINPPIWRRILVSPSTTLFDLHDVLQLTMGWTDSHLHEFVKGETHYQPPDPEDDRSYKVKIKDSRKVRLSQVLSQSDDWLEYLYDFGDAWEHDIELEEVLPAEEGEKYPICLAGARACPPEDCGSTPGYEDLVKAMRNPKHPEHKQFIEWLGGRYNPEEFDLDLINSDLADIPKAWSRKLES
jgi:hypothetical protein